MDPELVQVAQDVRILIGDGADDPHGPRMEFAQADLPTLADRTLPPRDRLTVRVKLRVAQLLCDSGLQGFGNDMLEQVRFMMHFIPREIESLGKVALDQAVMPDDLQGHFRAGWCQPNTLVAQVL